jgi:magnesium transporter
MSSPTTSPEVPSSGSTGRCPRVNTVACVLGVSLERGVATAEIQDYLREAENVVWMDVCDPGPEELAMLLEEFGFHPLTLTDLAQGRERPAVTDYKGYLFVVTYGLIDASNPFEPQTGEVDLFIGRNYVVTVHREHITALDDALARWMSGGALLREGVGFLTYTLLEALTTAYLPLLEAIENTVEETELSMFARFEQTGIQNLLKTKRTLVALRRVLHPLRETFQVLLRREHPFISANMLVYMQDAQNQLLRILDGLEAERDMVNSALEASLTLMSNRLNRTMKALTIITVCVALVGSVFGAWGMNFEAIPLSGSPAGFWIVAGGTVVLVTLALSIGAWRRWW